MGVGSLVIKVQCSDLQSLESLWNDYSVKLQRGLIVPTRTVILISYFSPSSAMAASSTQPETMKAECSLDNPKVHSFFLILFTKKAIFYSYYTIYSVISWPLKRTL